MCVCTCYWTLKLRRSQGYETDALPANVYLDKGDNYTVTIVVTAQPWTASLADLSMSFSLSDPTYLSLAVDRLEDPNNATVTYTVGAFGQAAPLMAAKVTVTDEGFGTASVPGVAFADTDLRISVDGATFACTDPSDTSNIRSVTAKHISFHSGCPTGRYLEYIPPPQFLNDCVDPDPYACVWVQDDYEPVFTVVDTIANAYSNFTGRYTWNVIGWGPKPSSVVEYGSDVYSTYNYVPG